MGYYYKNNQTIKLPIYNYDQSLKNFMKMKHLDNFKNIKLSIIE